MFFWPNSSELLFSEMHLPSCLLFQRLIETAAWGDDSAAIEQQLINHQRFHSSVQRSVEVDRARDDLVGHSEKKNRILIFAAVAELDINTQSKTRHLKSSI